MRQLLGSFLTLQLIGCATVGNRAGETISVNSNPTGADARILCDGGIEARGVTPTRLTIPRKASGCTVRLTKDGRQPETIPLPRTLSGKFWTGFWIGVPAMSLGIATARNSDNPVVSIVVLGAGVFGLGSMAVDAATGRLWAHEPEEIEVTLKPGIAAEAER